MPATDVTKLERADKPLVNSQTAFNQLAANTVAGVAEDLYTDLAVFSDVCNATGILISNNSGADAFLRGAAAPAGTGILIPDGGNLYLGWDNPGTAVIFLENSGAVDFMVFRV